MRELTDDEKELVESKKSAHQRTRKKYIPKWARLSRWAPLVLLVPVVATVGFLYSQSKVKGIVGPENFEYMANNGVPELFNNLEWITEFFAVYERKTLIFGALWGVSVAIAGIMCIVDVVVRARVRGKNAQEK